jgi:hypothetical protein
MYVHSTFNGTTTYVDSEDLATARSPIKLPFWKKKKRWPTTATFDCGDHDHWSWSCWQWLLADHSDDHGTLRIWVYLFCNFIGYLSPLVMPRREAQRLFKCVYERGSHKKSSVSKYLKKKKYVAVLYSLTDTSSKSLGWIRPLLVELRHFGNLR